MIAYPLHDKQARREPITIENFVKDTIIIIIVAVAIVISILFNILSLHFTPGLQFALCILH